MAGVFVGVVAVLLLDGQQPKLKTDLAKQVKTNGGTCVYSINKQVRRKGLPLIDFPFFFWWFKI